MKKATKKAAKKTATKATKKVTKKATKKTSKKAAPKKMSAESTDIIDLIMRDHKPLKKLIKTMKSEDADIAEKREAFEEFAPTLLNHAKPEEQTWYENMQTEEDMNVEALEGHIEHGLADQLVNELKGEDDNDTFEAKVKVLAEMVEHHIEEEEEEMLPSFRRRSTKEQRAELGMKYEELHTQMEAGEMAPLMNTMTEDSFSPAH